MRRILIVMLAIAAICLAVPGHAAPVTLQEAQRVAVAWYGHICPAGVTDLSVGDLYIEEHEGMVTFYTFIFRSGGFVIVAADDASIPILGYSESGPFPPSVECPATRQWLDDYCRQVVEMKKSSGTNKNTRGLWDAILAGSFPGKGRDVGPLLTTKWGNKCYFNAMCPEDPSGPCGHTSVGCIACSMAQVMKYYNHPPQGVDSHAYLHPDYGTLSADFGGTTYDWAAMPDQVTSDNPEVARLMYHVGVSVDMIYGHPDGESATMSEFIPRALEDHFNYFPGIESHYQFDYADPEEWIELLRSELDGQRPILYSGQPPGAGEGHAFVCDGYRMSDGMFHFNWGWTGSWDGWYAIGSLNPWDFDYSMDNYAITGIKPYNPGLVVRITGPECNNLVYAGDPVEIGVKAVIGNPSLLRLAIDGVTRVTSNSGDIDFTWNTTDDDCGPHELMAWAYEGSDSVFRRISLNVSSCWIEQSTGFQVPGQTTYFISPVDSSTAWIIPAQDGVIGPAYEFPNRGFSRTTDGGATWVSGTVSGCEGLHGTSIFGMSGQKAYMPMYWLSGDDPAGIYVTEDGGLTWNRQASAAFDQPTSLPFDVHFYNENEGWCLGDPIYEQGQREFEMYTTADGGGHWVPVPGASKPNALDGEEGFYCAFVSDTVWFGTNKGRVYKSADRGYNWTVAGQVPGMDGQFPCLSFRNGSHGLVNNFYSIIYQNQAMVFETFDGGETWNQVMPEGPMYCTDLDYVPGTKNTWVSSGGASLRAAHGASFSTDGGHTWHAFEGAQGTAFQYMAWLNDHCGWAGGTSRRAEEGGIYKFVGDISSIVASVEDVTIEEGYLVKAYPNPACREAVIEFALDWDEMVTIKLWDLSGRELRTVISRPCPQGNHRVQIDVAGLKSGIYLVSLQTGERNLAGKLVVNRD